MLLPVMGAAAPVALAQSTQVAENEEEVVVTARRREERLQDVPVAVTAMSGATLDEYVAADLTAIATLVPSMVVGRQVTGSSASIFLRGVGSTSLSSGFDQSVSLNLDGIAMSRGREVVSSQFDIQQVEVLKGPQALFFGKNSTGGVVTILTANPTDEFEASARVGYEFIGEETYGEAMVSGPVTDELGIRVAMRASRLEGFFDNPAQPNFSNGFARAPISDRRPSGTTVAGRVTLVYEPEDSPFDLTLKLGGAKIEDSGAGDNYERKCGSGRVVPLPTFGIADPYSDCFINGRNSTAGMPAQIAATMPYARDGKPYTDHDSYYGVATANYEAGNVLLTSVTGLYGFTQYDMNNFSGATAGVYVTQYADFQQFSQEFRAITTFDGPLNATLGFFYSDQEFTFNTAALAANLARDPATGRYDTFNRNNGFEGQTISAFAELNWQITPEIELAGGARWTKEERDSYAVNVYSNPGVRAGFPLRRLDDSFGDTNVSPQATISWKVEEDVTLYAAYKEGFKSGGFNTSITIGPTTRVADGQFGSEYAKGFEVGLRSRLLDGAMRLNLTAYSYRYEDLQVQIFDSVTLAQRVANAGELKTEGFELDVNWDIEAVDGLNLHATLAYNDATFSDYIGACFTGQTVAEGCNLDRNTAGSFNSQNFEGRTAPKAPKWAGRVGAAYSFNVTDTLIGTITADASFSSSYNYTDSLRPDGVQDSYTRFDASIRLADDIGGWEIALIGRNLNDELVVTSANDMPAQGGGTGTAAGIRPDLNTIVDRPRQVYLELSTRF